MKEEHIALLRRIRSYLPGHNIITTLAYIPPAQALRNQADRMEQQQRDEAAFDQLINEMSTQLI